MISRVTVLGASGFIGRYVVKRLAAEGAAICACSRHARDAGFLRPMGDVGQVATFDVDITNERALAAIVAGSDAVVNAAGIIAERGKQSFELVHHHGPARLARLAREAGVRHFVHISSISADPAAPSIYARTKAAGEDAVRAAFPDAVILRPALVFGPEDSFFNRFAAMARFTPVLPLIGDGHAKFQPVFVGDVAAAVMAGLKQADVAGKTYDIAGPAVFDLKQLFVILLNVIGRKRLLLPIPFRVASLKAFFLEFLPRPPLTRDQVRMLKRDAVAQPGAPGLGEFGITPQALELVLPSYLDRYRRPGALGVHPA
jgi:uncharacterized protein YbjT (DUF2867 family)